MFSHEHCCVVPVPTALFFNMSAIYDIFSSIEVWQLGCGDIVCPVCNAYPAAFLFFSVLCVFTGCRVSCLCPELYTQPGFCILTIFPVSLQFFFVLILMPPKRKLSVQQRPSRNTRLRPPPIEFISDALPPATEASAAPLPLNNRIWFISLHFSHCHHNSGLAHHTCHACYPAGLTSLSCNHRVPFFTPVSWITIT